MRLVIDLEEPAGECVYEVTAEEANALRASGAPGKLMEQAYELRRIAHLVNSRPGARARPLNEVLGIPARVVSK